MATFRIVLDIGEEPTLEDVSRQLSLLGDLYDLAVLLAVEDQIGLKEWSSGHFGHASKRASRDLGCEPRVLALGMGSPLWVQLMEQIQHVASSPGGITLAGVMTAGRFYLKALKDLAAIRKSDAEADQVLAVAGDTRANADKTRAETEAIREDTEARRLERKQQDEIHARAPHAHTRDRLKAIQDGLHVVDAEEVEDAA